MNRSTPILLMLATLGLVACDRPTVVNMPATQVAVPGPAGPTGATGKTGAQGFDGNTGATGSQGLDGSRGATGSQGLDGSKGDTGGSTTVIVQPPVVDSQ